MAIIRVDLFSTELHRNVQCKIVYQSISYLDKLCGINKLGPVQKVMILLPGFGEKYDIWEQQIALEDYARKYQTAFIMIDMYNSYAVKTKVGVDFNRYLFELVSQLADIVKLPDGTDSYSVIGISQGGVNAVLAGISENDKGVGFRNVASFSGCFGVQELNDTSDFLLYDKDFLSLYGFSGINNDPVLNMLDSKINMNVSIYVYCGENDQYFLKNVEFVDIMSNLGYDVKKKYEKEYDHSWEFWKKCFLDFCENI